MKKAKIALCISLIAAVLLSVLLISSFAAEPTSYFIKRVIVTPSGNSFSHAIPKNILYSYEPEVIIKYGNGVTANDGYISGLPSATSSEGFETHIRYNFATFLGFSGCYKWETEMIIGDGKNAISNFDLMFYMRNETAGYFSYKLARYRQTDEYQTPEFAGGKDYFNKFFPMNDSTYKNTGKIILTAYYEPQNDYVVVYVNGRYFWAGNPFKDGEKPTSADTLSFRMSLFPYSSTTDTTFKLCREELSIAGSYSMPQCLEQEGARNNYNNAYNDGFYSGRNTGHNEGYDEGYHDGDSAGYNRGKTDGYNNGYSEGKGVGRTEALSDIDNTKGLFLTAISAPFNAIKDVLNFEVFGINLSAVFFFLFTAVLIVFVIKKLRS